MCLKYLFFGWTGFFFLCCTPLLAADTTAIQKWNSDAFVQLQLAQAAYEWELAALCDSLQQVDEYLNHIGLQFIRMARSPEKRAILETTGPDV
jgi:hypothetical protein